ncbi:MAG TPA: HAD family hydrolase [Magnetospirillaceae bacterium]|jgi:D-glycero-D-manno-heptose 1,7-bisphosphate phosphatase
MPARRYVLLDRDGTINVEKNYLADPNLVELYPGTGAALRSLRDHGFGLAIVTNQSGIARGKISLAQLDQVHARLKELLAPDGVSFEGIYFCPHGPDDHCRCRKPLPGMVEQASRELGFDPTEAFMIGDKGIDIELGHNVGAATVLVRTGYGAETEREHRADPHFIADGLPEAARWIIARAEASS